MSNSNGNLTGGFVLCLGFLALVAVVFLIVFFKIRAEQVRKKSILAHQGEWGEAMCKWLISNRYNLLDARTANIMRHCPEWGAEKCQKLLQTIIAVKDTSEMVGLALGNPSTIDERVFSENSTEFRWIYGTPRQGAKYIWFKDNKVAKIKL